MNREPPTAAREGQPAALLDWLAPQLRWITVPSWLLSVLLHGFLAMLILMLSQLPSCQGDFGGESGEDFRSVGIRTRSEAAPEAPGEVNTPETTSPATPQPPPAAPTLTADAPPIPLTLPQATVTERPLLGAGAMPQFNASQFSEIIKPSPTNTPPTTGGGAVGPAERATSFLGVSDQGNSFVYIIDRSSSMEDDGRLRAAKSELLSSLQKLDESQRFQIIFYNANFTILRPRQERFDMFFGTDAQRLQVVEQLREVTPSGGTNHLPAIMRALKFRPDVIFLLTDGAPESALTRGEIEEVRIRNGGGTHIHCIEFGNTAISVNGRDSREGNFLHKLATENQGQYVYRNVLQLNGF